MNIETAKLRTLEAVHLLGSMTAAAAALGYTTGAVSQQMASLEKSLRVDLFEHVGRRVRLTDAGMVLFEHAGRMLALERDLHETLLDADRSLVAEVRIGVFGTAAAELLPPALARLRRRHPGLSLRTVEVDVDAATSTVESGAVHMAFGVDYSDAPIPRRPRVELRRLKAERFRLAVPARHAIVSAPVSLREFAGEGWILPPSNSQYGMAMRFACRRAGFEPRVDHEVTDTASSLAMVSADLGVAPVTNLMLALRGHGVHTLEIREDVRRELVLAYRNKPHPQQSVQTVLDTIAESVASPESVRQPARPGLTGG